jgi:hypothetical protein
MLRSDPPGIDDGKNLVHPISKAWATPAAVSYAAQGGEKMAKERGYQMELELFEYQVPCFILWSPVNSKIKKAVERIEFRTALHFLVSNCSLPIHYWPVPFCLFPETLRNISASYPDA